MAPTFTALGPRSTAAIVALYVKVGACLLAVGADVRRILVAQDLAEGRALVDALLGADQLVAFGAIVELVALVVAAVLFLRWQLAAHRNLPALGEAAPRTTPVGGVASWFVPGLNLFRPLQVVGDLFRAGERGAAVPRLLVVWWVAWLIAVVAVVLAWTVVGDAADVDELQRIDALRAGATLLSAVAAGLAIAVVSRTTARQERRAIEVDAPRPAPPTPEEPEEGGLRVLREDELQRPERPS